MWDDTWFNLACHMIYLAYLEVCNSLAASKLRHWTCRMNGSNFNVVVISLKSSRLRLFDDLLSFRIFQMASNSILSWEQMSQLHPFFLFLFWTFWNEASFIFILYFKLVPKLLFLRMCRNFYELPFQTLAVRFSQSNCSM